ncbi:MAG: TonB-dependent receptor [Bryobacterales bacterium]|nr:TonB-dependent receptor [Bryobacterales bacterium]
MRRLWLAWACALAAQQTPEPGKRVELNLLGQTDAAAGESRRNENIQFNLVDNNALKELNVRLGTTATIVTEFRPERNYFGAEFGNPPGAPLHVAALAGPRNFHGRLYELHQNSVFAARAFFQAGPVKPARENDYGFRAGFRLWRGAHFTAEASQQKLGGSVNGNVLVPQPDERTPLATDPAVRALIAHWLAAYPAELPNRLDVNPRALNANSPQTINNHNAQARLDQQIGARDRLTVQHQFTSQQVFAFQLVAGQNPDTDTKSHRSRLTWSRAWSAAAASDLSLGFDRLGSLLKPEKNAIGPMVSISGLATLGPQGSIPIDRAMNLFRAAGGFRRTQGRHAWSAGFAVLRRQMNGSETDAHRGYFSFANDFGHDGITNLRLGLPSQHIVSIGTVQRGFRNWDAQLYAGDAWRATSNLTLQMSLRYQPVTRPTEVNGLNTIPYDGDWNNLAPRFGLAYRAPRGWGTVRAAYGLQYGEIFPVTFQQVRFSPPGSVKIVVFTPSLIDPLGALTQGGASPEARGNLYLLDPQLATPYSHLYNFSWEPAWSGRWRLQLGYIGSRSHKLLIMWYTNRAHPAAGIEQTTATLNLRRPDPRYAEIRWVLNGSRGYFDAARVALVMPRWRGLSVDAAYWFGKALDLGSSYTNTAYDADSRLSRSQSEWETQRDMKGPSAFDQKHAFLVRGSYSLPPRRLWGGWTVSAVALAKTGGPFTVATGSDGPGYGNVDGNGGDRPNLVDPSVLGRSLGNPDTSRARLPRSAFAYMKPADEGGNLGRDTFRKGGIANVNAALAREWSLGNARRLAFRAESINLLNTPQFAEPGTELANANFGQITNTLNDGRAFRFQLAFTW